MKFAKLIRPLFLVALGLHGLALFLPVGEDSKTAEIEVAEASTVAKEAALFEPERLPVPDLNMAAGGAVAGTTPILANGVPTAVIPAQTAFAAQPGAVARSAPPAVATSNAAATRAIPTGESNPSSPSVNSPVAPSGEVVNSSPSLEPPTVEAADTGDVSTTRPPADENAVEENPIGSSARDDSDDNGVNRDLIASAINQLPDSLKALMNRWAIALTYNEKGTSDRQAKAELAKWTDKINAQASGAEIGRQVLDPVSVEDFAQVNYPIESAVGSGEQSFRICLDQPPSSPAAVGVLFDAQGEIVGEPELIRSTGYKAINDVAIAQVKSSESFPNDSLSKALVFEVMVNYDETSCAKLEDLKS